MLLIPRAQTATEACGAGSGQMRTARRSGLKRYVHSPAAGSYRLDVSPRGITVDFYAGASQARSARFVLR